MTRHLTKPWISSPVLIGRRAHRPYRWRRSRTSGRSVRAHTLHSMCCTILRAHLNVTEMSCDKCVNSELKCYFVAGSTFWKHEEKEVKSCYYSIPYVIRFRGKCTVLSSNGYLEVASVCVCVCACVRVCVYWNHISQLRVLAVPG